MMVALLEPAGPDLARRWVALLLMVDAEDRPGLVAEMERRVVAAYAPPAGGASSRPGEASEPPEIHVVGGPVQRDGYVEQVTTTYVIGKPNPDVPRMGARQVRAGRPGKQA